MAAPAWFADDASCVAAIAEGGEWAGEAMGALYARHGDSIRQVCRAELRWLPWAVEDLVHDVFARLAVHAGTIERRDRVGSWLRRVARHACTDYRKRSQHVVETRLDAAGWNLPSDDDSPDRVTLLRAETDAILRALRPVDADLLRDRFLQGMSYADMAATRQSTEGSMRVRVHNALRSAHAHAVAGGWRSLLPTPVYGWLRSLADHAKAWHPAVAGALIPVVAAFTMLSPPSPPASGSSAEAPAVITTSGVSALVSQHSRVAGPTVASPATATPTPTSGAADPPSLRAHETAPAQQSWRRDAEPLLTVAPVGAPVTGPVDPTGQPSEQPVQEWGVGTPHDELWVETHESDPQPLTDPELCDAVEAAPGPIYCRRDR